MVIIIQMAKYPSILADMCTCDFFINYSSSFSLVFLPPVYDLMRYPRQNYPGFLTASNPQALP